MLDFNEIKEDLWDIMKKLALEESNMKVYPNLSSVVAILLSGKQLLDQIEKETNVQSNI